MRCLRSQFCFFFFFNDTATTEIYTLSLHDALPISALRTRARAAGKNRKIICRSQRYANGDRKSTRLNSSHDQISYAVFCLKKKKKKISDETVARLHGRRSHAHCMLLVDPTARRSEG